MVFCLSTIFYVWLFFEFCFGFLWIWFEIVCFTYTYEEKTIIISKKMFDIFFIYVRIIMRKIFISSF